MNKLKVGVVGAGGRAGAHLSHLAACDAGCSEAWTAPVPRSIIRSRSLCRPAECANDSCKRSIESAIYMAQRRPSSLFTATIEETGTRGTIVGGIRIRNTVDQTNAEGRG